MSAMADACERHHEWLDNRPCVSVVPLRTPVVKIHQHIGPAKLAVGYTGGWGSDGVRGGEIWEASPDGDWILRYRIEAGTLPDELPWKGHRD